MTWTWDETKSHNWQWQEMIGQLNDDSQWYAVVSHSIDRSSGIVSCSIEEIDQYDHKRHVAGKNTPRSRPLRKWNFVIKREDGSTVALHPQWDRNRVQFFICDQATDLQLPRSGAGGTSGSGTYRYYSCAGCPQLRFDTEKYRVPQRPPVRVINEVPWPDSE